MCGRTHYVVLSLLALSVGSCSNPTPGGTADQASDADDHSAECARTLKLCLDSWTSGDSVEKFQQDHPHILFFDLRRNADVTRNLYRLISYEIKSVSAVNFQTDSGTFQGFQYRIEGLFTALSGTNGTSLRSYDVFQLADGTWRVIGSKVMP